MKKLTSMALAAALVVGGATLALAQNGQPTGGESPVAGGANGSAMAPGTSETSAPQTATGSHGRMGATTHYKSTKHIKKARPQ